jgi:asparagine synthase (glutamine-hydrolysing)
VALLGAHDHTRGSTLSAIAGIVLLDDRLDCTELIHKLTAAMTRRGPDARGHWVSGNVALGHCMLRTTPESVNESQPTVSRDGQWVIVMDGRLDHLDDLRRELNGDGSLPVGTPDAQYVLAGYQRWGHGVARRLLGDFAFIIWDARARTLYCARDCMGAKPLCFVRTPRVIAFASDEEAFLCLPGITFRPNAELIATLFVPDIALANELGGWDENVIAVEPGQYIVIDANGRIERETYWPLTLPPPMNFRSEADAQHAFEDVFCEALRCRMRSTGAVAALMSGGMDSAAIAAYAPRVAAELGLTTLATFSAISAPGDDCIESDAIRALIASPSFRASTLEVPSLKGGSGVDQRDLMNLAWDRVHPVDNSLLMILALGLAAQRAGHRVLLHGASGDVATHSPYWYVAPMLAEGRLVSAWRECRLARQHHTYLRGMTLPRILSRNAATAFAPAWLRALRAQWPHASPTTATAETPFNRTFAQSLAMPERNRLHALANARIDANDWRGAHLRAAGQIRHGLAGYDRTGARLGMETRDPWGDRRVLDFFLSLPLELKVQKGRTKYIVRSACAPKLPDGVPWRNDKGHVGWKFAQRVMEDERPSLSAFVSSHWDWVAPYLDIDHVRARVNRYTHDGASDELDFCYTTVVVVRWLKRMATR